MTIGTSARWDGRPHWRSSSSLPFSRSTRSRHTPEAEVLGYLRTATRTVAVAFRGEGQLYRPAPGASTQPARNSTRWYVERPLRSSRYRPWSSSRPLEPLRRRSSRRPLAGTPPWASVRRASPFDDGQAGAHQQADQRRRRSSRRDRRLDGTSRRHASRAPRRRRRSGRRRTAPRRPPRRRRPRLGPWTSVGELARPAPAGPRRRSGAARVLGHRARPISLDRQQRELQQVALDLAVVGLHPELAELVRAGLGGVEPDAARRPSCRTSSPSAFGQQRPGEAVARLRPSGAADEVDAGGDVAPLVRAAHLELDVVVLVQPPEVVGLQEHVAELGVGDAVVALHPGPHRLLGHHLVDGDVLADVPQELEHAHAARSSRRCRPASARFARAGREVEDALELGLDGPTLARRVSRSSRLRSSERPLGSPTMPVAPPASGKGRWPASWKRRSVTWPSRWPTWRLSAVGSKPT